jgi:hypothetical protein
MGNYQANAMSFPCKGEGVTVSTRSDPPKGLVVVKEVARIVANSSSFTRSSNGEQACTLEVMKVARTECHRLGGNYLLGANVEIKQFGDRGTWMVITLTGMVCVVEKEKDEEPCTIHSSCRRCCAARLQSKCKSICCLQ